MASVKGDIHLCHATRNNLITLNTATIVFHQYRAQSLSKSYPSWSSSLLSQDQTFYIIFCTQTKRQDNYQTIHLNCCWYWKWDVVIESSSINFNPSSFKAKARTAMSVQWQVKNWKQTQFSAADFFYTSRSGIRFTQLPVEWGIN